MIKVATAYATAEQLNIRMPRVPYHWNVHGLE